MVGTAVALATSLPAGYGVLTAWLTAVVVHLVWVWSACWRLDSEGTQRAAVQEDPTRALTDAFLLAAAVAGLAVVLVVMADAQQLQGLAKGARIVLGILTIVASWLLVHTLFTARYARTYYVDEAGHHISFNVKEPPVWTDFAYLAFTVGMTFQVSDTDLQSVGMRRLALSHMLLSYLFGAVIIAVTINTLAGLTQGS